MRHITASRRRSAAIIVALFVVAGSGVALWAADRGAAVVEVSVESALPALRSFDDHASAAEARIALASLRTAVAAQGTPERNGAHARRVARQLEAAAYTERRARSEVWDEFAAGVADLRRAIQTTDPQLVAHVTRLEETLRALTP
jgi:hypothetical protein